MFNARHIEGTLDDIKRIISCCGDTIDYTDYIIVLKNIIGILGEEKAKCVNARQAAVLSELMERAICYLKKASAYQRHYANQNLFENV